MRLLLAILALCVAGAVNAKGNAEKGKAETETTSRRTCV